MSFSAPGPPPLTFKRLGGPGGAVLVGVEFEGQLSVSSLQLLLAGVPLHPQDLIVVPTPLDSRRERRVTLSPQTRPHRAAPPLPPAPLSPPHAVQLLRRVGHGGAGAAPGPSASPGAPGRPRRHLVRGGGGRAGDAGNASPPSRRGERCTQRAPRGGGCGRRHSADR